MEFLSDQFRLTLAKAAHAILQGDFSYFGTDFMSRFATLLQTLETDFSSGEIRSEFLPYLVNYTKVYTCLLLLRQVPEPIEPFLIESPTFKEIEGWLHGEITELEEELSY